MNKQQIKQILDGAPDMDSFHWSESYSAYLKVISFSIWYAKGKDEESWTKVDCPTDVQKLSDLRAQLELIEENERLRDSTHVLEQQIAKLHNVLCELSSRYAFLEEEYIDRVTKKLKG